MFDLAMDESIASKIDFTRWRLAKQRSPAIFTTDLSVLKIGHPRGPLRRPLLDIDDRGKPSLVLVDPIANRHRRREKYR